jgi:hypothetical protein
MTAAGPERRIVVLTPHAEQTYQPEVRPLAPRCNSLNGARIVFVDNGFVATRIVHGAIRSELEASGIQVTVEHKRYWRPLAADRVAALSDAADAFVGGLGHTPPSSTWGMHDAVEFERRGVPAVSLATALYEHLVAATARAQGMPDAKRVILPHPLEGTPNVDIEAIARRVVGPVVAALTSVRSPTVCRISLDGDGS